MHPAVDNYIEGQQKWKKEISYLRNVINDCMLIEDFKWRVPCYTYQGKNVALVNCLKDYCAIAFFKGVLMSDPENILVFAGKNSQVSKLIKFRNIEEVKNLTEVIKAYVFEAIEIEKAGLKVETKKNSDDQIPDELLAAFEKDEKLKQAFQSLTPGRRRAYYLHFGGAKQSKTRVSRIEKYRNRILNGKGFHDCVCGLSKRMPSCDGSHKQLEQKLS